MIIDFGDSRTYLNRHRIRRGLWGTTDDDGLMGAFDVSRNMAPLFIISSGPKNGDWEHVSVSHQKRCPTWDEMCWVKSLFWGPQECVVEFHPPQSEYVNQHPFCLHLWKPVGVEFPQPPSVLVGIKK